MQFSQWYDVKYIRELRLKVEELDATCKELAQKGNIAALEVAVQHLNLVRHEYHVAQATIAASNNEPWTVYQDASVEGYLKGVQDV